MTTVAESTVVRRINRRLKRIGVWEALKKCPRRSRFHGTLGDYYKLDVYRNFVFETHVQLEELARKLGALTPNESLSEEGAS